MRVKKGTEMYISDGGKLERIFPDDSPVDESTVMKRDALYRAIYFSEQGGATSGYNIISVNTDSEKSWQLDTTKWREPEQAFDRNRELAEMIEVILAEELGQLALTIIFS